MERIKEIASTFFFLGYSPIVSGTVGSAGAMALAWGLLYLPFDIPYAILAGAIVLITLLAGIPLGTWAEKRYEKKDPSPFVLDEVMGYFVPLCIFVKEPPAVGELVAAFFLFRLFDIVKPFPARQMEKLEGGLGIMLDDFFAGIYALMGVVVYHYIRQNPVM